MGGQVPVNTPKKLNQVSKHFDTKHTHRTHNGIFRINPTMSDKDRSSSPEFSPFEFGVDFAPLPKYKAAKTTEIDFSGLLEEPLKLHEDLQSGCGGQLWPAGMVLAKHMLRYHRDKLEHSRMSVPVSDKSAPLVLHAFSRKSVLRAFGGAGQLLTDNF